MGGPSKITVTGCRGQLGSDFMAGLRGVYNVVGVNIDELDITQPDAVIKYFLETRPEVVVHCAAMTDVDGCEESPEAAFKVNAEGTRNIATACREIKARMIYFSTDYVFDGERKDMIGYVENDRPNPRTVYGKSKLAGEKFVEEILDNNLIVRISWLYGMRGKNFVKTMLELRQKQAESSSREPLKIVNDQFGNPTWTGDVVGQTMRLLESDMAGIVHVSSEGYCSWYDFAEAIFKAGEANVEISPCTTAEFHRPALRPAWSVLENKRLKEIGLNTMPDWHEGLKTFMRLFTGSQS